MHHTLRLIWFLDTQLAPVDGRLSTLAFRSLLSPFAFLFTLLLITACATSGASSGPAALYLNAEVETASASVKVDAEGGLHAAYVHFVAAPEPSPAVYASCERDCGDMDNWSRVPLADQAVDVQVELAPEGRPRLLIVTHSTQYPTGKDYIYAECDSGCDEEDNWALATITGSDGTSIFDVTDQSAPQRSFALDPEGRPAFVYQDRNYLIEPDHMGAFYASCDSDCTDAGNWEQTAIGIVLPYDAEILDYPSLAFTSEGGPRLVANVFALSEDGEDVPDGLYYYACDGDCHDKENWQRHLLLNPGSGSYPLPTWDLALDGDDTPHVALFSGGGSEREDLDYQLIYLACTGDCFSDDGWNGTTLGLPLNDGQGPDIEITPSGDPRIAFVYDYDNLGYASCDDACTESDTNWQAVVVETPEEQEAANPQAIPTFCDDALWQGLTPTLALDPQGEPVIAHDITVDARCYYEDPEAPDDPDRASIRFERVWNGVRLNIGVESD